MKVDPITVIVGVGVVIGALVLAVGGFRSRIRDDTISSQRSYIEQLERENRNLTEKNARLEERMTLMTGDWAKEVGQHVAAAINVAILPMLDQLSARLSAQEKRRET